jgi:hypothetical protein
VLEGRTAVAEGLMQKSWLAYCPTPPPRKQSALAAFYNARIRPSIDSMRHSMKERVDEMVTTAEEVGQGVSSKVQGLMRSSASRSIGADQPLERASGAAASRAQSPQRHPGNSSGRYGELSAAAVAAAAIGRDSRSMGMATRSKSVTGKPGSTAKNSAAAAAAGWAGAHGSGGVQGSGNVQGSGGLQGSGAGFSDAKQLAAAFVKPSGSPIGISTLPQLDLSARAGR